VNIRTGSLLAALTVIGSVGVLISPAGGSGARPVSANLDAGPARERIVPQQVCRTSAGDIHLPQPTCSADEFPQRRVVIEDVCDGNPHISVISSVQDTVDRLRVVNADGVTPRPEIFFDARSGATGRAGDIRVVRYDPVQGSLCWKPRRLFRYPIRATLGPVPRGAAGHDGFGARLGNFGKLYKGREIRISETYVDSDDAFCCPSFRRVTFFRYKAAVNRYVRYQTRVKRIKSRSQKP
jgi:hypothetical protein